MNYTEMVKENYLKELEQRKEESKAKINELINADTIDEADLEKIKFNVYDIFTTLFNVSYKKASSCNNLSQEEFMEKLKETYLEYFKKIPAPWREKYQKTKEMGLIIENIKEEIKLQTAEKIIEIFNKCCLEVKKD